MSLSAQTHPLITGAPAELILVNGRPAISNLPELARTAELASALGVHKTTLWRWVKSGLAPPRIVVGGTVYFQREDVLAWIASHKRQGL